MFWSKAFIPTLKEAPQEAESNSHKLMLRAGLVRMLMAGVYSYLPLGLRVLNNIEGIIRQEMAACDAAEVLLPALQPQELWAKSGRDKVIGEVMIRFT
ncbi:MAG: proline--tRNA ligase, partial [Candidatus Omnitrophica bacterium]|nr:proline--tRNA ligase [Candidatus Omnitrophota bacterium]